MVKTTVYIVADEVPDSLNVSYYSTTAKPRRGRLVGQYNVSEERLPQIAEICIGAKRRSEKALLQTLNKVLGK